MKDGNEKATIAQRGKNVQMQQLAEMNHGSRNGSSIYE
jgi:hypothetical protein